MDGTPRSGCTRRDFLAGLGATGAALAFSPDVLAERSGNSRPNVILITVDDMDYQSLGVTGCKIPDITPNTDALAREGMLFEQAHITSSVCQPSRSVLMTGRYPHRNGAMGFEPINTDVPTLQESLRSAGCLNGILAKMKHLAPESKFPWDMAVDGGELGHGRDPALYYKHAKSFFQQAKAAGKPFFLMANSQDPHRPFPRSQQEAGREEGGKVSFPEASRHYKPDEVTVPGFLPAGVDDITKEVAQYFGGVHRADEAVGGILRALKETGLEANTIVFYLSDNGMAFPFAKTNCYLSSTRTPLIVRWPGKVKPGSVNRDALVSGIDFMPTVIDAMGLDPVEGMDGRSILPLLRGEKQEDRDKVFTFLTKTAARNQYPMRCVRTKRFSYIFNAWSDGKTVFKNESQGGLTFGAMQVAAERDEKIAERVKLFQYRVPEEFYDLESDPCELENLIDDPAHKGAIEKLHADLLEMMKSTGDPVLEAFEKRIGA